MTTRRIVSTDNLKTIHDKDGTGDVLAPSASSIAGASLSAAKPRPAAPDVPKSVIAKLLFFTFSMIVAPLGSYYFSLNAVFKGNSTFAGATAAIVANLVLIAYIVVAIYEEDATPPSQETKKSQ